MKGLDMILSSLGIDPEKIKQEVESFAKATKETLANIDSKLSIIQHDLIHVKTELEKLKHGNIPSSGDSESSSSGSDTGN